jgi:hypothetical protein
MDLGKPIKVITVARPDREPLIVTPEPQETWPIPLPADWPRRAPAELPSRPEEAPHYG